VGQQKKKGKVAPEEGGTLSRDFILHVTFYSESGSHSTSFLSRWRNFFFRGDWMRAIVRMRAFQRRPKMR